MRKGALATIAAAMLAGWVAPIVPVQAAVVSRPARVAKPAVVTPRHQTWRARPAPVAGLPNAPSSRTAAPRMAVPQIAPRAFSGQSLSDPSFSAGPGGAAWQSQPNGNRVLIDGSNPRTPPYSADFCQNAANCADVVAQLIPRPGYIFSAKLTYWFTLRSSADPTVCANDVLQIGMETSAGFSTPDAGFTYCPDWSGAPYVQDSIDETLFFRNMQDDHAYVYAEGFSGAAGGSRYWVDDITLDITWGTPPGQPTDVLAEPHNGSVTLRWKAPTTGSEPVTGYAIHVEAVGGTAYNFTREAATTTAVIPQLVNGTPYRFMAAAISSAGQGPYSPMSNTVTPGAALSYEAVSTQQFSLPNSDGTTWQLVSGGYSPALSLNVTPTVDSMALITANADLWTSSPSVNQDLGVELRNGTTGQPEAWKESGGSNGTFSPNAAALEFGMPMTAGNFYVLDLVWKANRASPGATIYAGAGPIGTDFSPTRLTVQLVPLAGKTMLDAAGTSQFHPTMPSDGIDWMDLGAGAPSMHFVAPASGLALLTGNADLWTTTAGFNQDLAINVNGSVTAWKESGSFGGTYSPNAALVQSVVPVTSGLPYDVKLQWKPNRASGDPPIYAGAGPINGKYSPTRLTLLFLPDATLATTDRTSTLQYARRAGTDWQNIDATNLSLSITSPGDCLAILTGNADLWTAQAGINQDLGIAVGSSLGSYTADRVGWKESGGVLGAYSPNAAYVQTAFPVAGGTTYTAKLQWKTNRPSPNASIYGAAGIGPTYSPTRLTAQLICAHAPAVTSVSPAGGPSSGGTTVTIAGSNLDSSKVFFGGSQAAITSNTGTQIVATSPAHAVGTVDVIVTTGNGTSAASAADHFTYAFATVILADSPSIYYRFGETSGAVAADSSGNGYAASYSATGVSLGATGAIAGDPDTAISFDATNGIVQESSGAGLPVGNSSRSVECWFNTTYYGGTVAAWGTYMSGPTTPSMDKFFGITLGGNQVAVDIGGADWALPPTTHSGNFADGGWHHLVITYDSTSVTLAAYLDGQLYGSRTIQPIDTVLSAQGLMIGSDPADFYGNQMLKGSMDEFAIYSTALTPSQVATHYSAGRGR